MINLPLKERQARSRWSEPFMGLMVCMPILLLFGFLSFFNHPVMDDFWCTGMVRHYGYWRAQLRLYDIVPPRYFSLALGSLAPLSFENEWGYRLIPLVFMLLYLVIITGWLSRLYGYKKGATRKSWLVGATFIAAYLAIMPGIGEGYFWTSASFVYHSGTLLFVLWCGYLLNWTYRGRRPLDAVMACICLAAIIGCNELIAGITVVVMAAILLKGKFNKLMMAQLTVLAVCALFVLHFGGIGNRYALLKGQNAGQFWYSVGYSLVLMAYYIGRCLLNPFFWASVVAGWGSYRKISSSFRRSRYAGMVASRRVFLFGWLGILFIIPFSLLYLTGGRPPMRICDLMIFFFLFGLALMAILWTPIRWESKGKGRSYRTMLVGLLVLAGLLLKNNVSAGIKDVLSGDVVKYSKAREYRYNLIKNCRSERCMVPPLGKLPFVFSFDLGNDEQHASEYFDKQIRVAGQ